MAIFNSYVSLPEGNGKSMGNPNLLPCWLGWMAPWGY
jgi:hypothetical protein